MLFLAVWSSFLGLNLFSKRGLLSMEVLRTTEHWIQTKTGWQISATMGRLKQDKEKEANSSLESLCIQMKGLSFPERTKMTRLELSGRRWMKESELPSCQMRTAGEKSMHIWTADGTLGENNYWGVGANEATESGQKADHQLREWTNGSSKSTIADFGPRQWKIMAVNERQSALNLH